MPAHSDSCKRLFDNVTYRYYLFFYKNVIWRDMKEHKSEKELITAVIDLAASRQGPIRSSGELDEWLSFDSIVQALKELCNQLFVDKHIEQNCYQVLLKMSAESEMHLTWWEKIDMIDKYFAQSQATRKHDKKTTVMRVLPTLSPNLIHLVESERMIKVKPTSVPETSASVLREANELSMLLNGTYGFQADRALNSSRETRNRVNLSTNSHISSEINRADYTRSPSSAVRHIHFQQETASAAADLRQHQQQTGAPNRQYQPWRTVGKNPDHIEEVESPLALSGTRADARVSDIHQSSTPVPCSSRAESGQQHSDWTLSPSVIHHHTSLAAETPLVDDVSISLPSLAPRAPSTGGNTLTAAIDTSSSSTANEGMGKVRSRAFSDLLNGSAAMRKYMNSSMTSTNQTSDGGAGSGRMRARSESPNRSPLRHVLSADHGYLSDHSPLHRPSHGLASTPQFEASRSARKGLFGSPPSMPSPTPPQLRQHSMPSSTLVATSRPRTPGRAVPLVLQGRHGAGGMYTPEGHINFDDLDIDARDIDQHSFCEAIRSSDHMLYTVTSTTRILVLFHRWLLQRSDHHNEHFSDPRNAAVMLAAHFAGLTNFVSSLFGLEQWLREKMKLVAITEAKAFVFRTWNLQYGVSAQSRVFWRRRRLHCGFEAMLEFGMERRMHRKNALHALAARRRHLQPQFMSPVLHHPRTMAYFRGLFTEEELAESSLQGSPPRSLSQLSSSSRFAGLDASMRQTVQQRALYSTSLSIRELVNDAKAAVLTFSRGGNNANYLLVKTHEYLRAQDSVALLFAFRRFYHRSIYITRLQRVRRNLRHRRMSSALLLWRAMWAARESAEKAMEPQLVRFIEELKYVKLRGGLRKLQRNIQLSRRERADLREVSVRFYSKPIFLRALHMIRCAAYVKSFFTLKRHYLRSSPTQAEQLRSEQHCEIYQLRAAVHAWRHWSSRCSRMRKSGLRSEANRRALMGMLLRESRVWHIVQPHRPSSSTSMSTATFFELPAIRNMHLTAAAVAHTVRSFQLRRALQRLGYVAQSTRVFFSLMELRFAQALCRHRMPGERRKYMRLVNSSSCRILPSSSQQTAIHRRTALARREPIFRNPDHPTSVALQQTFRLSAEKAWRLVGVHPQSLGLYMRTMLNSTPLDSHHSNANVSTAGTGKLAKSIQASAEFMIPFLQKPITTIDGGMLCNTPQLLRLMRRWRQTCKKLTYLRKLADKVRRKQEIKQLRLRYGEWVRCFHIEKERNCALKRHAMKKTRSFAARNKMIRKANELTQRSMVERHWLRLAAAHTHHTELRRLRAGHFYNSVMDSASPKALAFIAQHHFVPFSVRHFLLHYPSYRFPIYKQYDAAFWEHSNHSAAFEALGVLCQHFEVYGNETDLAHHLEMFQYHHHEEFHPVPPGTAAVAGYKQQERVELFPHNYASPALRAASASSTTGVRPTRRERPLHLLPGAMLASQAFSVSAAIGSRYRRSAEESIRSGSPQKTRGPAVFETPLLSPRLTATKKARVASVYHDPDVPARSELASAALFMSHWISQCLLQFYALRRGLYLLRRYTLFRLHKRAVLSAVFLSKQRTALQALQRKRVEHKLTRQVQLYSMKKFSRRMRAAAVKLRHRRSTLLKLFRSMNHVYRYRVILRTWVASWRLKARTAWDRLVQFTTVRARLVDEVTAIDERRIVVGTVRTICGVTTANLWRRRRNRVSGLRAFVCHYNRNVRTMDREEIVRQFACVKFFTVLKEHILSLLRQRLASVIALNYRRKSSLIRGLLAIFSNVRQPHRNIREDVLRGRMHHVLELRRRRHAMYASHQYSCYSSYDEDAAVMRKLRSFNSFRQRQLMNAKERFNADFRPQAAFTPYVSATMPEPSPVPPAHTLDTPMRRASMLQLAIPMDARLSHDTLTETPIAVGATELSLAGNREAPGLLKLSRSLSRSASMPAQSLLRRPASVAPLPFIGMGPNNSIMKRTEHQPGVRAGMSLSVQTDETELQPESGDRMETMASMAERRRSFLSTQPVPSTRPRSGSFDTAAAISAAASAANRSALRIPRITQSPHLADVPHGSVRWSAEDTPLLVSTTRYPAEGEGESSSDYSSPAEEYSDALQGDAADKREYFSSQSRPDVPSWDGGGSRRSLRTETTLSRPSSVYGADTRHSEREIAPPRRYSAADVEEDEFSVRSDRDVHDATLARPQSIYGLERRPSARGQVRLVGTDAVRDEEASMEERSVGQEEEQRAMVRPQSIYGAERRASAAVLSSRNVPAGSESGGEGFDDELSVRSDTDGDGPMLRPQSIYGTDKASARFTDEVEEDACSVRSDRNADDPALGRPQSIYGLERRSSASQQGLHVSNQRVREIDTDWKDDEGSSGGEHSARQERAERSILRPKSIYGAERRSSLSVATGPHSGRSSLGGPRASVRWSIDDPAEQAAGKPEEESSTEYSTPGYSLSPLLHPRKGSRASISSEGLSQQKPTSRSQLRRSNSAQSQPPRLSRVATMSMEDASIRSRNDREAYVSRPSSIYGLQRRSSSSHVTAQSLRSSGAEDVLWRSDQLSVRSEVGMLAAVSRPTSVYGHSRHPSSVGKLSRGASAFSMASTIQTSASQLASTSQRSTGTRPAALSRKNSLHDAYAEAVAALPTDSLPHFRANSSMALIRRGSSTHPMQTVAADSDSDTSYSSVVSCSELFRPTADSGRSAVSRKASTSSMRGAETSNGVSRKSSVHDLHAEALSSHPASFGGPPSILVTSPAYSVSQRPISRAHSRINFQDSTGLPRQSSTVSLRGPPSRRTDASISPLTTFDLENTPRSRNVSYFDDNSTEASALQRRDSAASLSNGTRLHRPRSFIQAQRSEETAENALLLERAMQRGLWIKWRRQFLYQKYMNQFCDSHALMRLYRVYLFIMRRQTLIDKYQRQLLLHLTKRRTLLRFRRLTLQSDERHQVAQFADKFFVVMALKLGLRRWHSRIKKTTARMSHYHSAEHFRRKRTFSLFLLNLRASCAPLATLGLGAAALKVSPDRAQVQSGRTARSGSAQRRTGADYDSHVATELGRTHAPAHRTPSRLRFRSDSSSLSPEPAADISMLRATPRRSAPLSVNAIAALLHK